MTYTNIYHLPNLERTTVTVTTLGQSWPFVFLFAPTRQWHMGAKTKIEKMWHKLIPLGTYCKSNKLRKLIIMFILLL